MVHFKEESYEKLLDKLSESEDKIKTNENRSSNCLRSTKKSKTKNGKPLILHNIINEYGI